MTLEIPQSFVTLQECDKVAYQHGFRRPLGEIDGWRHYASTTAQGTIWLAATLEGQWALALDHAGVINEIDLKPSYLQGPGLARFMLPTLAALYSVMPEIYRLSRTLPDAPLQEFLQETSNLPQSTEAERVAVQRIGQDIFRKRLITYWQGRCPLTGIKDPALLRASHIKPWKQCESDAERLDVHNGLLLSALWDAAFDRGLVTFSSEGAPVFSEETSEEAREALQASLAVSLIPLASKHEMMLHWHREKVFLDDWRA